eukprot:TRINITY_DN4549_c0_g1_i1.p3 TRINITY_DN4549_c0_g1~~TRINITY_DN4549_c0_g1_i1.p3  ORF type:complete len:53 (-),score=0.87 TRINITY_DN4549_c0_g1_i1:96-254(-)
MLEGNRDNRTIIRYTTTNHHYCTRDAFFCSPNLTNASNLSHPVFLNVPVYSI